MNYPVKAFQELVDNLHKLPGIGPKTAERLSLFILGMDPEEARKISDAIGKLHERVKRCPVCFNLSDGGECPVCLNEKRDHSIVLVVEEAKDVLAIERAGSFSGVYHVIGGTIRLASGIGPEKLNIDGLITRVRDGGIKEIILATNLTHEGNLTAMYIKKELDGMDVEISRIASGIPIGTELEFADGVTLTESIKGRVHLTKE
jgi:recombination protein RecR